MSNPLNLPYSDSESETEHQEEMNTQETTEPEEQELTKDKQPESTPSTSQSSKINQLLKELYNSKHAEKQVNLKNAELIGRNVAMYDLSQEMKQKFEKTLERNKMLMKDNVALYRKIRLLRLQLKEQTVPADRTLGLETLAQIAIEEETKGQTKQEKVRRSVRLRGSSSKKS